MFPNLAFRIEETESSQFTNYNGVSFAFDFEKNEYVIKDGKLVEISTDESLKQFISWTLKTEVKKYKIYDEEYGIDRDIFIGKKALPTAFINSELKRQIQEQLTKHPLISDVRNFTHSKQSNTLKIDFEVITTIGIAQISEVI